MELKAAKKRFWNVNCDKYTLRVNAQTGKVWAFHHVQRNEERYRNRGRTGKIFVSDGVAARAHVRGVADKLGVSRFATLTSWSYVPEGTASDASKAGYFGGTYSADGKPIASFSFDIQDGTLVSVSMP
jgi:hypothetical protein